jgi:hypothetical protein
MQVTSNIYLYMVKELLGNRKNIGNTGLDKEYHQHVYKRQLTQPRKVPAGLIYTLS